MRVEVRTPSGSTLSGILSVAAHDSLVVHANDTAGTPRQVTIPLNDIRTQLKNRDGADKIILKIKLRSSDNAYQLFFTDPHRQVAITNRQATIDAIASYLSTTPTTTTQPPTNTSASAVPPDVASSSSSTSTSQQDTSQQQQDVEPPVYNRHRIAEKVDVAVDDFSVKQELLKNDKNLAQLFKDIVLSGFISEQEFWESRRHLLVRQAWEINQRQGPSTHLLDLRTAASDEVKFKFTPAVIDSILEQYGAVRRAYEANVLTGKMSAKSFWERFLRSKYFRKVPGVATADNFFDRFEKMEEEEAKVHPDNVEFRRDNLLLDLEAAQEDHYDSGNAADVPMQAGRVREALPVIRQYNMNSDRVMRQFKEAKDKYDKHRAEMGTGESGSMQEDDTDAMMVGDGSNDDEIYISKVDKMYLSETEITDLQPREEARVFPLVIRNATGYLQSATLDEKTKEMNKMERLHAKGFRERMSVWEPRLEEFNTHNDNCNSVERLLIKEIDDRQVTLSSEDSELAIQARKLFGSAKELLHQYYLLVPSEDKEQSSDEIALLRKKRVLDAIKETYTKMLTVIAEAKDDEGAQLITESLIPAMRRIVSPT